MTPKQTKMESQSENHNLSDTEEKTKRSVVIPGEIIATGENLLPGDGTRRQGKNIISLRYGLSEKSGRLVKVIPLSGAYSARRGNVIIGRIIDATFNGWIVDINAPYQAFLPVAECPRYISKENIREFMGIGDMVTAKVSSVKQKGIDLTIKGRGLGKLEDGMIIYINSNKVPRVIGRAGSMINIIKKKTNCDITVGQNGVIWMKGGKVDDELFAKEAIIFVTEKSFIEGLTEKVEHWLNKKSKEKSKK